MSSDEVHVFTTRSVGIDDLLVLDSAWTVEDEDRGHSEVSLLRHWREGSVSLIVLSEPDIGTPRLEIVEHLFVQKRLGKRPASAVLLDSDRGASLFMREIARRVVERFGGLIVEMGDPPALRLTFEVGLSALPPKTEVVTIVQAHGGTWYERQGPEGQGFLAISDDVCITVDYENVEAESQLHSEDIQWFLAEHRVSLRALVTLETMGSPAADGVAQSLVEEVLNRWPGAVRCLEHSRWRELLKTPAGQREGSE